MTPAEREELIVGLAPVVNSIARHRCADLPRFIWYDDIVSAAWLGAINAVDRYDPARNVPLRLWARWKISSAIADYLRSLDPVSRDERRRMKATGEEPPRTFSINATHDRDGRVFDIGDKRSIAAVRSVEARLDLAKICRRSTAGKGERDRVKPRALSIVQRHAAGETMKDIGRSEGVNESRVSQICKKTIAQLRAAA